jgi:hypothetical protein
LLRAGETEEAVGVAEGAEEEVAESSTEVTIFK